MPSHLVEHMNSYSFLYNLHHRVRENDHVEEFARNASVGNQTGLFKGIDEVNHAKFIWKLFQYGIRRKALGWIRTWVTARSQ